MTRRRELQELALEIADHQANLVRLGEAWGQRIVEHISASDKETLAYIRSVLSELEYSRDTAKVVKKLDQIKAKIAEIRMRAFIAAEKELRAEVPDLIDNETQWSKQLLAELQGEDITAFKDITDARAQRLLKNSIQINKTWDQWWTSTAAGDVQRIANVISGGVSQGLTIPQMVKLIAGSKASGYTDGVMSTSLSHARNLARTVSCGIANQAKEAFYEENEDAVLAVEWLSTLDGRTCPVCAGLDRQRWKPDKPHPVPPSHPSCRCVLIPVTPLTDLGADAGRPRANADFDAEAKRAYEAKYPNKRFEDLSPETRRKYRYEAMRRFEEETGKKAYTFGNGNMNFKQYFNQMSEKQKRDWLGAEKYEIFRKGNLSLDKFIPPYPDKTFTVAELRRLDELAAARRR